jgi:hypothetical protein
MRVLKQPPFGWYFMIWQCFITEKPNEALLVSKLTSVSLIEIDGMNYCSAGRLATHHRTLGADFRSTGLRAQHLLFLAFVLPSEKRGTSTCAVQSWAAVRGRPVVSGCQMESSSSSAP